MNEFRKIGRAISPIFVVGSGRSGTTIIKRCLARSDVVFSTNFEPMIFSSFDEKWGLAYLLQRSGRDDRLTGCLNYLATRYKFEAGSKTYGFYNHISRRDYKALLDGLLGLHASNDLEVISKVKNFCVDLYSSISNEEHYWLDDHIINGLFIPEIIKVFPEAKFIHPIRDGREVARSFIRKGWSRASYEQSLRQWHSRVIQTRALAAEYCMNNYFEIRFDELAKDPSRILEEVCSFVGVQFSEDMVSLFSSERAGQFTSNFLPEENRYFMALAPSLVKEFNWL